MYLSLILPINATPQDLEIYLICASAFIFAAGTNITTLVGGGGSIMMGFLKSIVETIIANTETLTSAINDLSSILSNAQLISTHAFVTEYFSSIFAIFNALGILANYLELTGSPFALVVVDLYESLLEPMQRLLEAYRWLEDILVIDISVSPISLKEWELD